MPNDLVLPAIKPEADQLQNRQSVIQSEAQTVHQFGQIAEVQMRVDVRVLKILHRYEGRHVKEPAERPVREAGPHADRTETDSQQRAYSTRQHSYA